MAKFTNIAPLIMAFRHHIKSLIIIALAWLPFIAMSQNISGVINQYTPVTAFDVCANSVTVNNPGFFNVGDRALIVQMKGATIDQSNTASYGDITNLGSAGVYEFGTVAQINGNDIVFQNVLVGTYDVTGLVQLITVPQYADVTINGTLTCAPWNGTTGGVLVFEASGTVTQSALVDVSGMGFRGGLKSVEVYTHCSTTDYVLDFAGGYSGQKGEGIAPNVPNADAGMGKLANGGGGGNHVNGGGGGGGNAGAGGNGGNQWSGCPVIDIGGRGGLAMTYSNAAARIFLGGGGGGGHQNDGSNYGSSGENGGGIVIIKAGTYAGGGQEIRTNGNDVTFLAGSDGSGGGGGGGTVLIDAGSVTGSLTINANGGEGGSNNTTGHGPGAGGGGGAIWVSQGSVPGSITTSVSGGPNGTLNDNTAYGAQPGQAGSVVTSLSLTEGTIPYQTDPVPPVSNDGPACPSNEVQLSGPTIPGATYSWTGPNGFTSSQQNPSITNITLADAGSYELVVTVLGCPSQPGITDVIVNPNPSVDFNATTVCLGLPTDFTNNSTINPGTITDFSWSFASYGNSVATNPSFTFPVDGTHSVLLTATSDSGCVHDTAINVIVHPAPEVDFTTVPVCLDSLTSFTNTTTINSGTVDTYSWDFAGYGSSAQTDPTFTFPAEGQHDVTLTATSNNGCVADSTKTITVYAKPHPNFTFTNACFGSATDFTDATTIGSGSIFSRSWDFGGQGSSSNTNPSFSFPTDGMHQVVLTAVSDNGCPNDTTIDVIVNPTPAASFTFDTVCLGNPTTFVDGSTISSGNIVDYSWAFGGQGTASIANPNFTFTTTGGHSVTLTATSDSGCVGTFTRNVPVKTNPVANFDINDVCLGYPAYLFDQSTIGGSFINGWNWDFGDNVGTSTDEDPNYNYQNQGNYSITLNVTAANGCTDDTTQDLTVHIPPSADFTFNDVCEDVEMTFTNTSTQGSGVINDFYWDFGDFELIPAIPNSTSTLENPTFTYLTPGIYNVTFTVTSDVGCFDGETQQVTVYPSPTPNFTFDTVCSGIATQFVDQSTVIGDVIDGWDWFFDDQGATSNQQDASHVFSEPGTFDVYLTATTSNGCSKNTHKLVTVNATPEVAFTGEDVCLNDTTIFDNQTTIATDSIVSYTWDFGDSNGSNDSTVTHLYGAASTYNVQLVAESDKGCRDTATVSVEVFPLPVVDFSSDITDGCQPLTVEFQDESTVSSGFITSWLWNVGNGLSSNQNPVITYLDTGIYNVSLIATTNYGCTDTLLVNKMITVYPKPRAKFNADPREAAIIYPFINIQDLAGGATGWLYEMGDGNSYTQRQPRHEYADTGSYVITQIVSNDYGCTDTADLSVYVYETFTYYIPNAFSTNSEVGNDKFYGKGTGIKYVQMRIFNRWGQEIYFKEDLNPVWDGTSEKTGLPVKAGVYLYQFKVTDFTGAYHKFDGHVTVID